MKIVGYSLLAIILFYLFLLVQFPYEAIKKTLSRNFNELNMGTLKIGKVSPSFPFELSLQNITWNSEDLGMQIPDLIMAIDIIKTVLGNTDIEIKELKNPQRLQGRYNQATKEGNLRIRLDNTELKVAYKNDFSMNISMSGEAKLGWLEENYEKINGEIWALLQRGEIEIKQKGSVPFFLRSYDKLRAEVQIKDGNILAKRLVISGKESREIILRDLYLTDLSIRPANYLSKLLELASISK